MTNFIESKEPVKRRIYIIRGTRVMLDEDLARLYGVTTKVLIQAVKRNRERFPSDFMYHILDKEVMALRSQFVTSKKAGRGGRRNNPYAFTEQGVAMLSSILHSEEAIQVNILIIREFVKMRELASAEEDLWAKIDEMEKKYDKQFQVVFKAIKLLLDKPKDDPGYNPRF
jgi:hypothetical protein